MTTETNPLTHIYFRSQTEVEERIARIQQNNRVKGLLIVTYKDDKDTGGMPQFVKNTFPRDTKDKEDLATNYGVKLSKLAS